MQALTLLTRRRIVESFLVATAGAAAPAGIGAAATQSSPSGATLGPTQTMNLGAVDFRPLYSGDYSYIPPGGVRVSTGSNFFSAGFRLPVNAKIVGATVYVNPMGSSLGFSITRYRPLNPAYRTVAQGSSTTGSAVEAISIAVNQSVIDDWNYQLESGSMAASGPILYGAQVQYRLPA